MTLKKVIIAYILFCFSSFAFAQDAKVSVTFFSHTFDGNPEFDIKMGETTIGAGTLQNAIDISKSPKIYTADAAASYLETVVFSVPVSILAKNAPLEVRITNDKYDKETKYDRNIAISSALINQLWLGPNDFVVIKDNNIRKTAPDADFVWIYSGKAFAAANAPAAGWPVSAVAMAGKASNCTPTMKYNFFNFDRNLSTVSDNQANNLDSLVENLVNNTCKITITGFASISGSTSTNIKTSQNRANAVADYLRKNNIDLSMADVIGFGETSQFGTTLKENRRVVVTISEMK